MKLLKAVFLCLTLLFGCSVAQDKTFSIPQRQGQDFRPKISEDTVFFPEGVEIKIKNPEILPISVSIKGRIYTIFQGGNGKIKVTWRHR